MPSAPAHVVLIDWGTTNARAYRIGPGGVVVDRRRLARGVRQVPQGGFPAAFAELLGPWRDDTASAQILMQGMVGSRQGWIEVPYRACPTRLQDLADHLQPVPDLPNARIVPGVSRANSDGTHHDVIRGEEVQVFGAVEEWGESVVCLPGTHSKWVLHRDGLLVDFATSMTGEAFDVFRRHSLLGALMSAGGDGTPGATSEDAFRRGLDRSAEAGGLLNHLFSVRSEGLFGAVTSDGLAPYLSGILIGHEIRAMADRFPVLEPVRLVAEGALAERYASAFDHLGRPYHPVPAEAATLRGLMRILECASPLP